MAKVIGLYGYGGFGREIMPVLKKQSGAGDTFFFVESEPEQEEVQDTPVISHDQFLNKYAGKAFFNIAISNSKVRQSIAEVCLKKDIAPLPILSGSSENLGFNDIDQGAIISGFCTIGPNTKIGQFFQSEYYSYIAHDCVIGDYVTFAPRVNCNGNVHIGDHAYIGTGAIIKQGTPDKPIIIGKGAIVGMGAVVTKDVPPGVTVVGNPARPFTWT